MKDYRYPTETLTLVLTIGLLLVAAALVAGPTLCLAPLLVVGLVVLAYQMNQGHHRALMQQAVAVTRHGTPQAAALAQQCVNRLRPGPVQFFIVRQPVMNAYTFGLSRPYVVVLYEPLFHYMDEDELRFVIGHELGHVALQHAWLNTLLGGMGGVPVSFGGAIIFTLAFRWWNRACEFSCDRAGLLACGRPDKAVSALVKLVAADADTPEELRRALAAIEAEDDSPLNVLAESLSTHPMLVRRIQQIRQYAANPAYQRLQASVNQAAPL
ncbi:MAG: M48 family metallopeptidase [Anaerolineaceae bacterium]|nr:M48 family metallopeptidase [Anaerolineaceae bacterium]